VARKKRDLFGELSSGIQAMREHREGKIKLRKVSVKPGPTYQIRVTLLASDPPIWRRLRVSGNVTLARLHKVIQTAMGWTNSHAHMFEAGSVLFGDPEMDWDAAVVDERKAPLAAIANEAGATLTYEYDMGDSWRHEVVVEEVGTDPDDGAVATCVAGERACPPEDCGGIHGYYDMLERLRDSKSDDYEETRAWIEDATGGPFDPDAFDLKAVNRALKKLR
jgi:hypothetical protein